MTHSCLRALGGSKY
uniref:Uncharacterized protein n=1 Tax=Arundo donax TaxID=35708 RepID=A0A0A8ZP19_ARUDO